MPSTKTIFASALLASAASAAPAFGFAADYGPPAYTNPGFTASPTGSALSSLESRYSAASNSNRSIFSSTVSGGASASASKASASASSASASSASKASASASSASASKASASASSASASKVSASASSASASSASKASASSASASSASKASASSASASSASASKTSASASSASTSGAGSTGAATQSKITSANAPTGSLATVFGPDSQVSASQVTTPIPPPVRSSQVTGSTSHGPYSGSATTTGAPMSGPAAASVGTLPPNPTATYYNANGLLTKIEPAPYTPAGGLGTNGTLPRYQVESDFDFESIALGLYQEWIELDLFHNGLAVFNEQDFLDAGLTAEDRSYIEFMADQESGHATLLTNMLGQAAPPQCTYDYPYKTVREFTDFCQRLTRFGESGVWGFINHLDSREVGQLLAQSIATEARQQMTFRQMSGLHPMPVWFETGIPQSWAWTFLAQYISSCPANTTRLAWQNFPTLHIVYNSNINRFSPNDTTAYEVTGRRIVDPSISTIPENQNCIHLNVTGYGCGPAIAHNRSEPLSFPGKQVFFEWENPGLLVGPNNSYVTSTAAGAPLYVGWVNQLNLTYSPLVTTAVNTAPNGLNAGYTFQPAGFVYAGDGIINDTMFVILTDTNAPFTPFNLSMINPHVRALGMYQAG